MLFYSFLVTRDFFGINKASYYTVKSGLFKIQGTKKFFFNYEEPLKFKIKKEN
jgi:hypothetical protein